MEFLAKTVNGWKLLIIILQKRSILDAWLLNLTDLDVFNTLLDDTEKI